MVMASDNHNDIIEKQTNQLVFDLKRGFLQFVTLYLISQQPRYAYEIKDEILRISGGTFDIDRNNLYKKLRVLEKEGFLKSQLEPSQQGADRKYYSITPFGKKLFNEMYQLLIPVMGSLHKRIKQS
jgi:PadR family transcriptional regulator PadR